MRQLAPCMPVPAESTPEKKGSGGPGTTRQCLYQWMASNCSAAARVEMKGGRRCVGWMELRQTTWHRKVTVDTEKQRTTRRETKRATLQKKKERCSPSVCVSATINI